MKDKKDIFKLIGTLSKSEKRYFKLNANLYSKSNTNNYIQLFDFINKKHISVDFALLSQFGHTLSTNQLAVTKNYLYKIILASMTDFYKKQNNSTNDLLLQVKFLFNKGLISQAKELIKIAKKEIETSNALTNKLELMELELEISNYTPENNTLENLDCFYESQQKLIAQQELVVFYKYLYNKKNILEQKADNGNINHYSFEFKSIYDKSKSKSNSEYHTFYSKYYLHLINKHCSINLKKVKAFHIHGKLLIRHLKNHPKHIKKEPEKVIWAYYSYIYSFLLLKKTKETIDNAFFEFDGFIQNNLSKNKPAKVLAKTVYFFFSLKRNIALRDNIINEELINNFIANNEDLIPLRYKMNLHYLLAYYCFNECVFDKTIVYLQKSANLYNQKSGIGKDIFITSKLLLALTYNEMEEDECLYYSLQSVYYYLYKDETKKVFENKVLELIKILLKTKLNYQLVNEQISRLNKDKSLNPILDLFDFNQFFNMSKIKGNSNITTSKI